MALAKHMQKDSQSVAHLRDHMLAEWHFARNLFNPKILTIHPFSRLKISSDFLKTE